MQLTKRYASHSDQEQSVVHDRLQLQREILRSAPFLERDD